MGSPKGLLRAPEQTTERLVERLARVGAEAGLDLCLVGQAGPYDGILTDVLRLEDDPAGIGPLGGLSALLARAGERHAISVACDMPFVDAAILRELAAFPSACAVIAPRRGCGAPYEPMLARWEPSRALPVLRGALGRGVRSFQGVLAALEVEPLAGDHFARALIDWDTPEDVVRSR